MAQHGRSPRDPSPGSALRVHAGGDLGAARLLANSDQPHEGDPTADSLLAAAIAPTAPPGRGACLRYLERLRWGECFTCRFCGVVDGGWWQMADGLRRLPPAGRRPR